MVVFVEVSLQEQATDLTRFFCKLLAQNIPDAEVTEIYNTLTPLIPSNLEKLISEILSRFNSVFPSTMLPDVESCMQVLGSLLLRCAKKNKTELLELFCKCVTSGKESAACRLTILSQMFSLLEANDPARLVVLEAIVAYAGANDLMIDVTPALKQFAEWATLWKLDQQTTRRVLADFIAAAKSANVSRSDSLELVLSYLRTFEEDTDTSAAAPLAVLACTWAIEADAWFSFETIMDLKAVRNLEKGTTDQKHAFNLINIFASGTLASYKSYTSANSKALSSLGLSPDTCECKMRLLTLASAMVGCTDIDYSTLATALEVDVKEVEVWVIRAINAKLVEAKINQLDSIVHVSGCSRRSTGDVEWKDLQKRVHAWRNNVDSILSIIRTAKESVAAQSTAVPSS